MEFFKIYISVFYGLISMFQTLNARAIFKSLHFNFYSTVFLLQRLVIIFLNFNSSNKITFKWDDLIKIAPYSFIMCTINILSSYCVTIMPLAAFMAFKKFVVFFVFVVAVVMNLPTDFNRTHYICIAGILFGGFLIGEKDIFRGQIMGYISSLIYTSFEAISLQYASYLYGSCGIGPQYLLVANSILSVPFYVVLVIWDKQYIGVANYSLNHGFTWYFLLSLIAAVILAIASEYTANAISMKVSPFEKASVSNIKDLLLTMISIYIIKDIALNPISEVGIIVCLTASIMFSCTILDNPQKNDTQKNELIKTKETYKEIQPEQQF